MKFNLHAGHNPDGKVACGAVGILKESTQARKVTKKITKYLRNSGHTVYNCTVNNGENQYDVLNKIIKNCNKHIVDLSISIHFNSGANDKNGNGKSCGCEVLINDRYKNQVKKTATSITNHISKLGFKNRGVKIRNDLFVLNQENSPILIVECCFVDDKDDFKIYNYKKMAQAITLGILEENCANLKYKYKNKIYKAICYKFDKNKLYVMLKNKKYVRIKKCKLVS